MKNSEGKREKEMDFVFSVSQVDAEAITSKQLKVSELTLDITVEIEDAKVFTQNGDTLILKDNHGTVHGQWSAHEKLIEMVFTKKTQLSWKNQMEKPQ